MSDSWRDSEGQVIDGQFPLVKHLGGSDHSVVFATQRGKDKAEKAAIKFIQADASNADAQLARWKQVAQLAHPNLIKVFESGRCQLAGMDLLYVVTEFAQENLAEFLPQRALSSDETRDMLDPFVESLSYLHGKGFAHGRIKPGNILAIDDQLKLSSDSICRDGDVEVGAGKPDIYVAPETNGKATAAGDVWSLGATIVESLTQRRPEEAAGDPSVPDSMPQPFLDVARNTLRRDPKVRWTVAEISNRLNPKAAAESANSVAVAPPPPPATAATRTSPAAGPAAVAIAEPPKPSPAKSAGATSAAASASAATAVAIAPAPVEPRAVPLAKPTKSIDPLSVPLSTVEPHFDAGKSSSKGWYIAIALMIAFAAGAWYTVPQVREFTQGVISSSPSTAPATPANSGPASSAPVSQPASQPTAQPPADSKPDATPPAKPSTPPPAPARSHGGYNGPQVSSVQPPSNATPNSTPASERTAVKKDAASNASEALHASSIAHLPATSRTAAVASTSLPAGPVTQGQPLNQVMPEVSSRSRSTIHGTVRVIVKVRVSPSGAVESAVPASSPSRFFGDAAVQAAKRWDFTPAKVSGQAVPSEWLVRFDFTPTDTKVLPSETKP